MKLVVKRCIMYDCATFILTFVLARHASASWGQNMEKARDLGIKQDFRSSGSYDKKLQNSGYKINMKNYLAKCLYMLSARSLYHVGY